MTLRERFRETIGYASLRIVVLLTWNFVILLVNLN